MVLNYKSLSRSPRVFQHFIGLCVAFSTSTWFEQSHPEARRAYYKAPSGCCGRTLTCYYTTAWQDISASCAAAPSRPATDPLAPIPSLGSQVYSHGLTLEPSAFITKVLYSNLSTPRSDRKMICVLSGDQTGAISYAVGLLVRLVCSEPSVFIT